MSGELNNDLVIYRPMSSEDIPGGLHLCRQSRWNQLAEDWTELLALCPQGGRVALVGDQIVGSVITLNYENRFTWIGMLLVDPACRGKGIGSDLFSLSLQVFPELSPQRLDATPQGHPVYQRFGFRDEYELMRMQLSAGTRPMSADRGSYARSASAQDLDAVFRRDHQVFGADRKHLLEWAFRQAPEYAWIVEEKGNLKGYCFGRHGHNFEQVGPVVADSSEIAILLLSGALSARPDSSFIVDVPCHHGQLRNWLNEMGFTDQRPFTRMFLAENRFPGNPENLFAIFGPEFG